MSTEPYRVPPENGNCESDVAGQAAMDRFPIQKVMEDLFEGFAIAKVN